MKSPPPVVRGPLRRVAAALALCAAPWCGASRAHAAALDSIREQPVQSADADATRLTAWPEIPREAREQAKTDVERLRKARTPEMGAQAHAGLLALGAACMPAVLDALGNERDEEARDRLRALGTELIAAPHTRLLAAKFDHRSAPVRIFCLERVAAFPDSGIQAEAQAALARARAAKPSEEREAEVLAAALACASSGAIDGMDELLACAQSSWSKRGAALRTALEAARGPAATQRLEPELRGERARAVAALNLLAACGARESAPALVRPFLDHEDNSLRVAAINALRGIVDGAPPLERLPVFEAIEEAKRWKERPL